MGNYKINVHHYYLTHHPANWKRPSRESTKCQLPGYRYPQSFYHLSRTHSTDRVLPLFESNQQTMVWKHFLYPLAVHRYLHIIICNCIERLCIYLSLPGNCRSPHLPRYPSFENINSPPALLFFCWSTTTQLAIEMRRWISSRVPINDY